jgi:hypothetical protein
MARKYGEDRHEEAMNRLCFVCTDIIKGQHFPVEKNEDLLSRALQTPELFLLPGITPYYYCLKCSLAVKRAARGVSIKSTRQLQEWGECGDNCATCMLMSKRKSGAGRKKVSCLLFLIPAEGCKVYKRGSSSVSQCVRNSDT